MNQENIICYGLKINSKEEGDKIVKAINSIKFKEILKYTKWSTFQTDWRMFKYFKQDFWKEFQDNEDKEQKNIITDNKPEIIKNEKSNYYLIDNKLYKIKRDKTQGEYYSDYIDGKIIKNKNKK